MLVANEECLNFTKEAETKLTYDDKRIGGIGKGRYLNDVSKIFGFLDPLPPLVTVPFTLPISTLVTF